MSPGKLDAFMSEAEREELAAREAAFKEAQAQVRGSWGRREHTAAWSVRALQQTGVDSVAESDGPVAAADIYCRFGCSQSAINGRCRGWNAQEHIEHGLGGRWWLPGRLVAVKEAVHNGGSRAFSETVLGAITSQLHVG